MKQEIIKGMVVGVVGILIIVAIGMAVGFACSGGDYEVAPPEDAERVGHLDEDVSPSTIVVRG